MPVGAVQCVVEAGYPPIQPHRNPWPRKIVIAVVDDDGSMREAVTGLLRSHGYVAIAFERAEDFLNSERRLTTACLIADVQMPGMTGPDLHNRLVASGEPIPTILITAYPDQAARARALQSGVRGYLTKPFPEADLIACVQGVLDSRVSGDRAHPDDAREE
jgi:FixJ family two-component response regulator